MALQLSNDDVALYLDVFVFSTVVIFALFGFPHLVARLSLPHCEGWFIRKANSTGLKITLDNNSTIFDPKSEKHSDAAGSTESGIAPYRIELEDPSGIKTLRSASRKAPRLPVHVPSYSTWLHPLSKFFTAHYDGYSVGQYTILMAYLGVVAVAMFLFSNPVNNITRAGFVCVAQAPIVVLFGVKNGPIGTLLGKGYEKLNYIHRWVGQLMFLSALFHVVGYLVRWTKTGTLAIAAKRQAWGWFAFGGLVFLAILSMPPIRRSSYALFWHAHWVGFLMFAVSAMYHAPAAIPYAVAGLSLYALDHVMRLFKSRVATATLTPVPALKCTQLSVPELTRGWRAGQHVRVRVLNSRMGTLGWAETHPFTIASISAPEGGGDGLTLLCKRAGDWTESLYSLSQRQSADNDEGFGMGSRVKVVIEGPYGGPGSAIPSSFSSALIVAGGSGITFGTSSVEELILAAESGATRTKYVELVWVVQEQASIMPLLPAFATLLSRAAETQALTLAITVHFTRASNEQVPTKLPVGMRVVAGRPNLKFALDNVAKRTDMVSTPASRATGVYLGVCGPAGLVEDAWSAEAALDGEMRTLVGGVEVHEEAFGW